MLWPFAINWISAPLLRLEWFTDVKVSRDDTEYRDELRDGARRTLRFETAVLNDSERVQYENLLIANQGAVFQLPWWPQQLWITAPINVGDVSIAVTDISGRGFAVGVTVALVHELRTQLAVVQAVNANEIVLTDDVDSAWPIGTKIVRVFNARIQAQQPLRYLTDAVMTAEVVFDAIDEWTDVVSETGEYLGLSVLEKHSEASEDLLINVSRAMEVFDNKTGKRHWTDLSGYSRRTRPHRFVCDGMSQVVWLFNWLAARRGRANPFWLPTQQRDFQLMQNITAVATQFLVANVGHSLAVGQPGRNHISIRLKNGTVFRRRITAITQVNAASERVTISSALGAAVSMASVEIVCYVQKARLSSDAVEISYMSDEAVQCSVGLTLLKDHV